VVELMLGFGDDILDLIRIRDIQLERSHALTVLNHKTAECVSSRAVATTRYPCRSAARANSRPKPVEQPVISQTCDPSFLSIMYSSNTASLIDPTRAGGGSRQIANRPPRLHPTITGPR